ncbi:hypothetical protein [Paraflavitalea speifideaquila]|uniref:hypothetical protein n=1 Tax=Paraflavitalea speifideaquila TaxID=3076558 RepID=UPI0028E6F333|nr:hypothetical protein [Paraflavitalea speifideiaquila]
MKQSYTLLLLCFCLSISFLSYSQTVQYPEFSVSIYRYAQDQRYSEYKSMVYLTDIDPNLANNLFPMKGKSGISNRDKGNQTGTNIDSFRVSISQELTKVGLESQLSDIPDLSYVIIVNNFSSSLISAGSFGTNTYSLTGKARVAVVNGKKEVYMMKDIDISEQVQQDVSKLIKNSFTNELGNQASVVNYTLLFQAIQRLATRA